MAELSGNGRTPWEIQRTVVMALILRELKSRFGAHRLGYVWVPLEPALHMMMLVIVFGFIRQRVQAGIDFPVFLIVGLIPYLLFKNISLRTMNAMDANRALFAYRQIKPMDTFLSRMIFESVMMLVVYVLMLFFMGGLGFSVIPVSPLLLALIHALLVLFALGFGLILCVTVDWFSEARLFVQILYLPLYFISGVMFPLAMVPPEVLPWISWNPVLHFVELARSAFFPNYQISPEVSWELVVMVTLFSLFLGLSLYYARRTRMVRR
jgi:capsular polysaccharide transport system permease protein